MMFFKRIFSLTPYLFICWASYIFFGTSGGSIGLMPLFLGIAGIFFQWLAYDGCPVFGKYNNALKKVMNEIMATEGEFESRTSGYVQTKCWYWSSPKTNKRIYLESSFNGSTFGQFYDFTIDGKTIKLSSFDKMIIKKFFDRGKEYSDKDKEIKIINDTLSSMIMETYEKEQEELQKRWNKIEEFKAESMTKVGEKKKLTS